MSTLQNSLQQIIDKHYPDCNVEVTLTRTAPEHGDFASNVAMQLTKLVGKNPREIAEDVAAALRQHKDIAVVEIAGPGFINIRITDAALLAMLSSKPAQPLVGKKILVEYSDPNPFKPLHAGHLYTTLVGDSIARLVQQAGAETIRLNFGGDVGRHVGISMWAIIRSLGGENPQELEAIVEQDRPTWLGQRYVEGTAAFEIDETAKAEIIEINKKVYALHDSNDHDSDFAKIYWTCRDWSYTYFAKLYNELGVVPFDRYIPESEVTPLGLATVKEQLASGVYAQSDGAVVFLGEPFGLHTRVFINSEGLPTYEAKDVGLSLTKWQDYHFDSSIIITANEQMQYMQTVLKSIEQFAPEPANRTIHLTHGVVKLQGGIKMSSRKGNIVSAMDIINEARAAGAASGIAANESTVMAAIKYAFLKQRMGGDIIYDPQESISMAGNSGPYLQYAHARARSILQKSSLTAAQLQDIDASERALAIKISEYNEVIMRAQIEYMPHHICAYLYELTQTFNRFYENEQVIGSEREAVRCSLLDIYANTLKQGLGLLGIDAPERM
ncbi:arginine--tRNA ligase [bacterium]|nr:arginine--tRNA ligase [bacterium]NDC94914.1 arginine--tRNA ligase [bacterium]NDD84674.1 arginine--tRNA ligase [bacterium]NDG29206.1 arginine--tRNA ligase [bacterium]